MKFIHVRDDNNVPFATLAVEGNQYGVSICSPYDNFDKARGREIAIGRLKYRANQTPIVNRTVKYHGKQRQVSAVILSRVMQLEDSGLLAEKPLTLHIEGV